MSLCWHSITKTGMCIFYPLKPHSPAPLYVKSGIYRVYIIFLILLKNIDCEYSLERLSEAVLTSTHNLWFWTGIWKISGFFYLKIFLFWL